MSRAANYTIPEGAGEDSNEGAYSVRASREHTFVTTRDQVAQLHAEGMTGREIAAALDIARSTVSYHLRRLGIPPKRRTLDWAAMQAYYDAGHSVRECCEHFGCSTQTWHEARKRGQLVTRSHRRPVEELIARRGQRGNIKRRFVEAGLLTLVCAHCGVTDWRGKPLALHLHHINGDGGDHRLENLQILCPNCHSQTDNFSGRNRRRIESVTASPGSV